jgi:AmiR/NasT family two-component response regulator
MYRALIAAEPPMDPDEMGGDLETVGFKVINAGTDVGRLAQAVVKTSPDVVIAGCRTPSEQLFQAAHALTTLAPCPFVLFTSDGDFAKIERATESGIHSYVVEGYARHRLLSIVQVARARFRREQILKDEFSDLSQRYEERKQIDRAKGVLMRSRGISEDEAFEVLRHLAMNSRQRIGLVALYVVDTSRAGEAVNKAGQMRMLSQRVVRCYAQSLLEPDDGAATHLLSESVTRVLNNFTVLKKAISTTGFQERLSELLGRWQGVRAILDAPADATMISILDERAERMLGDAESLTAFLESSGLAPSLYVLNIAGRQRMLSQRIAKLCFLLAFETTSERLLQLQELSGAFQMALDLLGQAPLSSQSINNSLRAVGVQWLRMKEALSTLQHAGALTQIAQASEQLLEALDVLSIHYEQAMQVLVGDRLGRLR